MGNVSSTSGAAPTAPDDESGGAAAPPAETATDPALARFRAPVPPNGAAGDTQLQAAVQQGSVTLGDYHPEGCYTLKSAAIRNEPALANLARYDTVIVRPGTQGPEVAALQRMLAALGCYRGDASGVYNDATTAAVAAFQKQSGETDPEGIFSDDTLIKLDGALAKKWAGGTAPSAPVPLRGSSIPELAAVLSADSYNSTEFQQAVARWPSDKPIWSALTNRAAREQLVRYIVANDDTHERSWQAGKFICNEFSSQMYARYSSRSLLKAQDLANMKADSGIDVENKPAKLRVPVFCGGDGGHAYNAFLLDEAHPDDLRSYMVLEPQTSEFITRDDPEKWKMYVGERGLDLFDLAGFDEKNGYAQPGVRFLFEDAAGRMVSLPPTDGEGGINRVASLIYDLTVQDAPTADGDMTPYMRRLTGASSFPEFLQKRASGMDDDQLLQAGRIMIGKAIREPPGGAVVPMTAEHYCELIGRPDLRGRFG
jgi:peptidoglycan hydrolase-like protein with peptidoglycan-binding domain